MTKLDRAVYNHNNEQSQVLHKYCYSACDFFERSSGNLLINAGMKEKRREMLLSLIEHERRTNNKSIVIFSNDSELKSSLIHEAKENIIGNLYVFDSQYKNYDFFYKMPQRLVSDFFCDYSEYTGSRDTETLMNYTGGFLKILAEKAEIKRASISAMLENSDDDIRSMSLRRKYAEQLSASSGGGVTLRSIFNSTEDAFETISQEDCDSENNIASLINTDSVILIDIDNKYSDILSIYFSKELETVMNESFNVIFDDSTMMHSKCIKRIMHLLKTLPGVDVVCSCENVISMDDSDFPVLSNYGRQINLLDGNCPFEDLQAVLSTYGTYTALKSVTVKGTPPMLIFNILHSENESTISYSRDRVLLQDEIGNEAVIKGGSSSRIYVVQKFGVNRRGENIDGKRTLWFKRKPQLK